MGDSDSSGASVSVGVLTSNADLFLHQSTAELLGNQYGIIVGIIK